MTHLIETTTEDFKLMESGEKTFEIIKSDKPIRVGDSLIFQRLADTEQEETKEGEINDTPFTEDEFKATVTYIYTSNGELKKGYYAAGFKEKE